jgi:puromycin-sensitive aminopeptidase
MAHLTSDKNFRLPGDVRPARYVATLSLDLEGKRFSGTETIDLVLARPVEEIVLHAVDLDLARATCRSAGRALAASWSEMVPESQTAILRLSEPLPAGAATLEIAWTGRFSPGLRGLYQAGPLAVTQFEAADARRVFPCFDEPGFKAPWAVTLEIPSGVVALANGAPVSEAIEGDRVRITHHETPPLSSYLVALACGRLEAMPPTTVRGVPVRTWAVPGKLALTAFGHTVAAEVLPRLEDYFGLPYAFGKLDQVAVPDFEAGAMENAGLITYREVALLLDPATASLAQKKRVAEVVTHELAHQWFGNWVTMQWWDDLWLNEAFATWMAFKVVDAWNPGWRVWLDFDASKAAAMQLDALRSTHSVRADVHNADEATESFDAITYEKGGAVLRMIEGYLGTQAFREGIRGYMCKHAQANAVADDLWGALAEASRQPVVELANAWIRQAGFPLVRVQRRGGRLELGQRRFFSEPGAREEAGEGASACWPVPMVIRFADERSVKEHRFLLRDQTASVDLPAEGEVSWVCANAGATGFYRVVYDSTSLAALGRSLGSLASAERIALLADEWALVRSGEREVAGFLDLCSRFGSEEDYAVLDELAGRFAGIEQRLEPEETRLRFRAFVSRLLGPQLEVLGWDAAVDEPDATRLRRAALVRALGLTARAPAVIAEGERRLERFLGGDRGALEPNLQDAAVAMAARVGDARRFDALRERFQAEADPAFRKRYLQALAAFEDPVQASRAQAMILGDEVPLQDSASFIGGLLSNRTAREPFWKAMREGWAGLAARIGGAPMLLRRVVEAIGQLPERRHLEEAEAFLSAHPMEPARQAIAQTLERMRQDVALYERLRPAIGAWLAREG